MKRSRLGGLVFASEDYSVASRVKRTATLDTFQFPRAHMQCVASAYQLDAIDLVCIDVPQKSATDAAWRDQLEFECRDGKQMGFRGK